MKYLRLILAVTFMLGSVFTALSQTGVDSVKNYNNDVNQNPTMDNDNQNINNPNQRSFNEFDKDVISSGENSFFDYQLNKEDSVTLFKKGGALINTDTMSTYPINGPSDRSYGGSKKTP